MNEFGQKIKILGDDWLIFYKNFHLMHGILCFQSKIFLGGGGGGGCSGHKLGKGPTKP